MAGPKCPACGDKDRQRLVGEHYEMPAAVYHCLACDHLYAVESDDDENDD